MKIELGLLVSGRLGYDLLKEIYPSHSVNFVATDLGSLDIVHFCRDHNIDVYIGNPRKNRINSFIQGRNIDLLLSVNYLFLIEENLIQLPNQFAINIHGSILPKYRGRTPHVWAIINNEKEVGVTAHLIEKECDAGPIVLQRKLDVDENDTGATLLAKYSQIYPSLVKEVIQQVLNGSIKCWHQEHQNATYFGKRTPEDGEIDWSWQKERIRNWVRAQTKPYPGAFSYFQGEKIIIYEVTYSEFGFNYTTPNGTILHIEDSIPIVKTSNGALFIKEWECAKSIQFLKGEAFYARY